MSTPQPGVAGVMEPWQERLLSKLLGSIRVRSSVLFRPTLAAPWGFSIDMASQFDALVQVGRLGPRLAEALPPGAIRTPFHIVTDGTCWLKASSQPNPIQLTAGDFVVFPRCLSHTMLDTPMTRSVSIVEMLRGQVAEDGARPEWREVRFGGAGAETRLMCGGIRFENVNTHPLLAILPPLIHVRADQNGQAAWLRSTVDQIVDEYGSDRLGREVTINRLTDILFIGAIRSYFEEGLSTAKTGWLAAVRDDQIGRAIALLHAEPTRSWTVEALSDRVAMSRSAFANRFTELVGQPPLRYLTRLRLDAAAHRLRHTNDKLSLIAAAAGYASPAAFCRAFQRHVGSAPGEYRRKHDR
jgi:AraC-like DNA-binding protein